MRAAWACWAGVGDTFSLWQPGSRFAGTGQICGGADPGRRNLTNPLIAALDGGTGLPRLDTSRLRATWLAGCADRLGLAAFMQAAGISCSQRLGDLVAGLEPAAAGTGPPRDALVVPGTTRSAPSPRC